MSIQYFENEDELDNAFELEMDREIEKKQMLESIYNLQCEVEQRYEDWLDARDELREAREKFESEWPDDPTTWSETAE